MCTIQALHGRPPGLTADTQDSCLPHRLYTWPRNLLVSPIDVLPQQGAVLDEMLHPVAVERLWSYFDEPAVATCLNVRPICSLRV